MQAPSSRSIYFDCMSQRPSTRSLWTTYRRATDSASLSVREKDRIRLLHLLDSMKQISSELRCKAETVQCLGDAVSPGGDGTTSGDGVANSHNNEDDDSDLENIYRTLRRRENFSTSFQDSSAFSEDDISNISEGEEEEEASEDPGPMSDSGTEDLNQEGIASDDETSTPGDEGNVKVLGTTCLQIPKLQLHLLSGVSARSEKSFPSHHGPVAPLVVSPAIQKQTEKLYDLLEDLGHQICEDARTIEDKYAAQKEKSEFYMFVNQQLMDKYERALRETETLENEIERLKKEEVDKPPISLYSLMMGMETPREEGKRHSADQLTPPLKRFKSQPDYCHDEVGLSRLKRHSRSMSVESQAEIRFVCLEAPKVTIGVGETHRFPHKRFRSMEVNRVDVEPVASTAASPSIKAFHADHTVHTPSHSLFGAKRDLFQRMKQLMARLAFGKDVEQSPPIIFRPQLAVRNQPFSGLPRINCGESL
eukprot:Gregarina_sp_Pseudo_9__903@NODE_157_length_3934_cov_34_019769_g144_i0_p1_GENE_NODE_157_length_3934_cov_34_019769_g144_i0NODE_157_length_3934_cov_34_019769_g144_i0_p1_ORF_typecomplete_len478_score76_69ZapB/PF06005_12/0_02zfC4H2/PF10146_9/3_2e03zfC4H2/PF10146_9/0_22_NODE_157_length_3934_cov_34_019769_g144_i010562489